MPGWGFGFGAAILKDPVVARTPQSAGTYAWGSVYGHSWFVDPKLELSVVALTNTTKEDGLERFLWQYEMRFTGPSQPDSKCVKPSQKNKRYQKTKKPPTGDIRTNIKELSFESVRSQGGNVTCHIMTLLVLYKRGCYVG